MASSLDVSTTPPPRIFAVVYMLHLSRTAMFTSTLAYERNPFVIASMLLLFFWVYVWPSIIAIKAFYAKVCTFLRYIWLPSLSRLAIAHIAQSIWTFDPPVAILPPLPSALTSEDCPVHDSYSVHEGFSVSSASGPPRARHGFRRVCHKFYVDSYLQVTFRFSG
jgi:hypothetical protein